MAVWIVVGIVALLVIFLIATYNRLVRLRNRIEAATVPGVPRSPLPTAAGLVEWSQTKDGAVVTIDHATTRSTIQLRVPENSRLHRVWPAR
ncbi:MAG: hypothetical protein ACLGHL_01280, partial [Actinomycetota bacterium]